MLLAVALRRWARQTLMDKMDSLLGHLNIDAAQIDARWEQYIIHHTPYIIGSDCATEPKDLRATLRFIVQLKRQGHAIRSSGEYGLNS